MRGLGYHSEHPGEYTTISDGDAFVQDVIDDLIASSAYGPDTLVLVAWDEGGGFFDHVAPPASAPIGKPYGTRVPLIASGPFVRAGSISHVQMEHSSIVKFIEWNWLGDADRPARRAATACVANLGSLLDPSTTGVAVP